tara:strand:+ start:18834 stop:19064 length:231 start_codon:yes stop_codon:yes gene_type:complete
MKNKKYHREHLENLAYKNAELYNEYLAQLEEQKEIDHCKEILTAYLGIDDFNKLSNNNLKMVVGAMQEYAFMCKKK